MLTLVLSVVGGVVIFWFGWRILHAFGRPTPPPPAGGELRKVDLRYTCGVCGAEVRMTAAADDEPEPPRHCMEEMELIDRDL